ncbi:UDP-N-acetylmuramoyl-L-alanine--D-glutamate ligase [Ideonella sp. DXS22W]|uniref:UDP-N-acetylmuramoylalanine--D-glutamate ligase n=1 Tax=Pseudaquabacterium inlustre TaxID=2984192 RepID=A0ABU9CCG6_9BURK
MNHLQDLDVLVLGLGDSGLAMARWCARHGARVQVWDSRPNPPQAAVLTAELPAVTLRSGTLGAEDLGTFKLVLKSPGLAPHDARIVGLLDAARATGIALGGELDLFARALADLKADRGYAPAVLAITGTNGKTTTTSMTALLVERCGKRVAMAGNIGPTMLDTLAAALDAEPVRAPEPEADAADTADQAQPAGDAQEAATGADEQAEAAATDEAVAAADTPEAAEAIAADADIPADDDEPAALPIAPPPPAAPTFEVLPEVWVLELSSFQLDGVQGFAPSAAAVLNITQDHLDWHGDMAAYTAAKARIYGPAGVEGATVMVINRDDLAVESLVPAPVVVKGGRGVKPRTLQRKVVRFGLDAPQQPGDFGLVTENGMAWLVRAREVDETLKRSSRKAAAEDDEIQLQRLMPADALRVRGRHNAANALAALALATAIGCPLAPMLHGLRDYGGEPHRVAYVATVGGVEAFDDSKGTNVGATVAALVGLGADKAPAKLVVILGGDGKGQDFAPLAAPVARHARAVALIGRDAPAIQAALADVATGDTPLPMQGHDTLQAAVAWCFEQARPGDAVLLSPACASLDMFRNYAHRAEVFVAAVQAEADARGEMF